MWLDLLIALILLVFAVGGYQHGFTKSLVRLVRFIASIAIAYLYYGPLAAFMIEHMAWPAKLEEAIASNLPGGAAVVASPHYLAVLIVSAVSYLLIYIAVSVLVTVVGSVLEGIMKIPVLREADKLAGIIAGLAKGALAAIVVSTALCIVGYAGATVIASLCESSALVQFFYLGHVIEQLSLVGGI